MAPVTVVVATRNRRDTLLRSLAHHRAPVVVVDNASTDGTVPAVRAAYPGVRVVPLDRNAGAAARTVGVTLARTPYVAFADDDSYWEGESLERAARLFAAYPRVALLTAQVRVGPRGDLDPLSAYQATAPLGWSADLPGPAVCGFLACAAAVRREAFLAVGGFAPRLHVYGEEALLALDLATAGWGLAYAAELVVRHLPAPAGRDPGGRAVLEARNRLLTAWLRRSPRVAAATTASALRSPSGRRGLAAALAHLDWVAAARRRVPAALDRQVAAAERGWNDFLAAAAAARPPAGGTGAAGTADAAGGAAAPAEGPSRVAVSPTRAG